MINFNNLPLPNYPNAVRSNHNQKALEGKQLKKRPIVSFSMVTPLSYVFIHFPCASIHFLSVHVSWQRKHFTSFFVPYFWSTFCIA